MRSLDPDIARVEREGVAAFDAVPLQSFQEELRHPMATSHIGSALAFGAGIAHKYDAAWIGNLDDEAYHPQR